MKKIAIFLLTFLTIFTIAGCKKKNKYITPDVEGNLLENGNFNYGEVELASSGDQLIKTENGGEWWCYALNGGFGQISINKKRQLEVGIVMTSNVMHGVQFAYDGFAITKGSKYSFEFDACCDIERSFEIRIQQNGGNYENYILEGKKGNLIDKLGTEMKHYKYEFTSAVTDIAPRMAMNLGWFEGDPQYMEMETILNKKTGLADYVHKEKITFDNFSLVCTYDSGVVVDPLDLASRPKITLNQVGFLPGQVKQAVFRADKDTMDKNFKIYNVDTQEYEEYKGYVSTKGTNPSSLEYVGIADFSDFTKAGKYKLVGENCGESPVFTIGDTVYDQLFNDTIMMLYRQRCGEVLGEDGDKFAHAACHQSTATIYGTSTKIDVSGGWHDAGDYGKYVVPGAQTVANLLDTFDMCGDIFHYDSYVTNDAAIPDILEEAMYELDWMLKMQANNGQVYHKVTSKEFPDNNVKPQSDNSQLFVSPTSYAATADFAAVMAKASGLFTKYGILSSKAEEYKNAAIEAYNALNSMQKTSFKNPSDIKTGEYPDADLFDELTWASIEMYALTNNSTYLDVFKANYKKTSDFGLGWANVNGFGIYTYLETASNLDSEYANVKKVLLDAAQEIIDNAKADVYNASVGTKEVTNEDGTTETTYAFEWGSNLTIASNGIVLLFAIPYSDVDFGNECIFYLQTQINYLLGQNACAYCFVTGYGELTPENPHHRPSVAAGEAMKGMLVGGPDSNFAENGQDSVATRSCKDAAPAHCYIDNDNSWSTNEVTIYWNSPFTLLLGAAIKNL